MKKKIIFPLLFCLLSISVWAQGFFPGGVVGAEVWYIANHSDFSQNVFKNEGNRDIKISSCASGMGSNSLFNFNHSINATTGLCLAYNAPLENTTSRNIFFVGEPKNNVTNYKNVSTLWNPILASLPQTDSLVANRFDVATRGTVFNKRLISYTATENAHINFYHWNMYQTERKFKSYGIEGETSFIIGQGNTNPLMVAEYYIGNFPEFISFPFELSGNQKNRVESYLALKYGITLKNTVSYRSSKNVVFWNYLNNGKFGSRIFGIGKDGVSGLNQLQSESVHAKNYLVASVGELVGTNPIKQGLVGIPDENFIVFGDNAAVDGLDPVNAVNVRTLKRKWLSQNTNVKTNIPIFLRLNTLGAIKLALVADPSLKLWMLHDKSVNNTQNSNFTSQYVDYYETSGPITNDFGNFTNILFDPDKNTYDQFTFGVGPKMIVQVRFDTACSTKDIKATVIMTGGKSPYTIRVKDAPNKFDKTFTSDNSKYGLTIPTAGIYTFEVTDSGGNTQLVTIDITSPQISVNLGPDVTLNSSVQQVTLNADQAGTNDPTATYSWYRNGALLEEYQSTLVVTEPGTYKVEVTSGNRMCQKSDTIIVGYNFTAVAVQIMDCTKPYGTIYLQLSGGTPPYTTVISGPGQTTYQVHSASNMNFSDIGFGSYTVTTTDSKGQVIQKNVVLNEPSGGIQLDLLSQLQQSCIAIGYNFVCYDVVLNAGALVTNPNVSYEWFMDGVSMNIFTPTVLAVQELPTMESHQFEVRVKNLTTGCIVTETFYLIRGVTIKKIDAPMAPQKNIATSIKEEKHGGINSKVYPNPSESGATFYYEVFSDKPFNGTVEIFSPTGALIQQQRISGNSAYKIPFTLSTSGLYLICTKTNGILLTDKIIIK